MNKITKDIDKKITIITSFVSRLYDDKFCKIVESMKEVYPTVDFYVYHENSEEERLGTGKVDIKDTWDKLHQYDLFKVTPWLSNFLETSFVINNL